MLNQSLLSLLLTLLICSCASRNLAPGDIIEVNTDFDLASIEMQHGWEMLTSPKITYVGIKDPESEKRGQTLFHQHCAKCHGISGKGDGPLAEKLNISPANLTQLDFDKTNTYLVIRIKKGNQVMPAWQEFLEEDQMFDLTNYIRTLKKNSE